jgi:hypothetical protein
MDIEEREIKSENPLENECSRLSRREKELMAIISSKNVEMKALTDEFAKLDTYANSRMSSFCPGVIFFQCKRASKTHESTVNTVQTVVSLFQSVLFPGATRPRFNEAG